MASSIVFTSRLIAGTYQKALYKRPPTGGGVNGAVDCITIVDPVAPALAALVVETARCWNSFVHSPSASILSALKVPAGTLTSSQPTTVYCREVFCILVCALGLSSTNSNFHVLPACIGKSYGRAVTV